MSWKLVWTRSEVDLILDSMAEQTRLPRAEIDALLERAHPHKLRDQLLERQWIGRLAYPVRNWADREFKSRCPIASLPESAGYVA